MTASVKLFFVEFGSFDSERIRQAIQLIPLGCCEVESQIGAQAGANVPVPGGIVKALELLFEQKTLCISVRPSQSEIKWILLFGPNAMDSQIPMWHGMLELRSLSHEQVFQSLKRAGLQYVAIAKDEPFDLAEEKLKPDQFPWNSSTFVAAAIADDKGNYIEGPLPR